MDKVTGRSSLEKGKRVVRTATTIAVMILFTVTCNALAHQFGKSVILPGLQLTVSKHFVLWGGTDLSFDRVNLKTTSISRRCFI